MQITADLDVRIVMDGLISTGVFDNKTWQLVEAEVRSQLHVTCTRKEFSIFDHRVLPQKTEQLRASKLIDLLPTRGPKAFLKFLDCLRKFYLFFRYLVIKKE